MLVRRRVEDHRGMIRLEYLVQTLFVADGADEHRDRDVPAILLLQLHQQLVGAVLVDIKDEQFAGLKAHHLTAELAADGTAAARDEDGLAGQVAGDLLHVQRDFLAGEEIGGVQLAERILLRRTGAHQLRVAQDLDRTVGGDAEVNDMVQSAALQRRDALLLPHAAIPILSQSAAGFLPAAADTPPDPCDGPVRCRQNL